MTGHSEQSSTGHDSLSLLSLHLLSSSSSLLLLSFHFFPFGFVPTFWCALFYRVICFGDFLYKVKTKFIIIFSFFYSYHYCICRNTRKEEEEEEEEAKTQV